MENYYQEDVDTDQVAFDIVSNASETFQNTLINNIKNENQKLKNVVIPDHILNKLAILQESMDFWVMSLITK